MLRGGEQVENAVDGHHDVGRVQDAEHQVTRLRGTQTHIEGVHIQHFPDEDNVGVLSQDGARILHDLLFAKDSMYATLVQRLQAPAVAIAVMEILIRFGLIGKHHVLGIPLQFGARHMVRDVPQHRKLG